VKPFSLLKIPVLMAGFGALMFFAPASKAQSEVGPDHFDGTDAWEMAARRPVIAKTKAGAASASYLAQNKKAGSDASLELAAAREVQTSAQRTAVAVQDKRKPAPAVGKPDQK
jgi:hypothetical protein